MSSANVIVLSSSPSSWIATTPPRDSNPMSSSPHFPSPSQLLTQRRSIIYSGSRAVPVPSGVIRGFAPASSLLARPQIEDASNVSSHFTHGAHISERPQQSDDLKVLESGKQQTLDVAAVAVKKPRASRKKSSTAGKQDVLGARTISDAVGDAKEHVAPIKKSRKKRTEGNVGALSSAKQPKVRKSKEDTQTTIKKTKIVKPSIGLESGEKLEGKKPMAKRRSSGAKKCLIEDVADDNLTTVPLGLEKSLPRRRSWTPIRDCDGFDIANTHKLIDQTTNYSEINAATGASKSFTSGAFLNDFGYEHASEMASIAALNCKSKGEPTTKKRKIELIDTSGSLPPTTKTVKRNKSPKKKPQTITEKATAEFRQEAPPATSLLHYLAWPVEADSTSAFTEVDGNNPVVGKPIRKAPFKAEKPKVSRAKTKKVIPVLLPPEEAMDATKDQDILFGTSSQLMRDESPSFVRDIQKALVISEEVEEVPNDCPGEVSKSLSSPGNSVSQLTASRNLWSRAARDSHGALLEVEVVDLVDTPKVRQPAKDNVSNIVLPSMHVTVQSLPENENWTAIEECAYHSIEVCKEAPLMQPAVCEPHVNIQGALHSMPHSVAEAALRLRTKSCSPVKKTKLPGPQANLMPNYQGFTMNGLSKAVTRYGFKAIKGRNAMISLLEQCWESKSRLALQSLPPNTNIPQLAPPMDASKTADSKKKSPAKRRGRPSKFEGVPTVEEVLAKEVVIHTVSPSKQRGRPRKNISTKAIAGAAITEQVSNPTLSTSKPTIPQKAKCRPRAPPEDEIEDSNSPPTPSPPRRRSPTSPPQPLPLSAPSLPTNMNGGIDKTHSSSSQAELFAKITQAITGFPPTHDPKNLSWYEKILLYDPIVLEDLATWLNTEGLGRVGMDEEVGPLVVRAWCEERSICCLWRENLRGGKRGRY